MHNYVRANQETGYIQTPPDNYRPDKIGEGMTIDQIQQQRNVDVPNVSQVPQFEYKQMDF